MTLVPASRELIIRATTHPRNWPLVSEYGQKVEDYKPAIGAIYLAHGEDGYLLLHRAFGTDMWMGHIAMLPGTKGVTRFVSNTLKEFSELMGVKKYIAATPADLRAPILLLRRLGFEEEGRVSKVLMREPNQMVDLVIHGALPCQVR